MEEQPITLNRSITIDEGYASRAARLLVMRAWVRRPTFWIGLAAAAIAGLLALLGAEAIGWVGLFIIVLLLATPIGLYLSSVRAYRVKVPAGSVASMGFGVTRFAMDSPGESSTTEYAAYTDPVRDGEFVVMRIRGTRSIALFPGALLSDDDLARFPRT